MISDIEDLQQSLAINNKQVSYIIMTKFEFDELCTEVSGHPIVYQYGAEVLGMRIILSDDVVTYERAADPEEDHKLP